VPQGMGTDGRPWVRRTIAERSPTIDEAFDPHANSLSFLRLLFAAMVLVDHSFPIGGFSGGADPMWHWTDGQESFGGLAVAGFFVVSGYLVTRSFVDSKGTLSYLWKRFLRIFPGFWVCLCVTVLLFGPLAYDVQNGSLAGYWQGHGDSPWAYLWHNWLLSMNQYNIDGLLRHVPYQHSGYPPAFDGSLWTLIYEFKCYLGVAVFGLARIYRGRRRLAILLLGLILWATQLEEYLHPGTLKGWFLIGDSNMTRLAFIFSLGMLLYLYRDCVPLSNTLACAALVMLIVAMRTSSYYVVGLPAFAYLCMWLAIRLPIRRADRFGDFSYGLYIYAFPVQQLYALYRVENWGLLPYVAACLCSATLLAAASWYVVEKPCLRLKRVRLSSLLRRLDGPWQAGGVRSRLGLGPRLADVGNTRLADVGDSTAGEV